MRTHGVFRILRFCLGLFTLGLGKSGRCSRPETNTKLVRMRLESDFRGSFGHFRLEYLRCEERESSCVSRYTTHRNFSKEEVIL
jgi:hypothetical protein